MSELMPSSGAGVLNRGQMAAADLRRKQELLREEKVCYNLDFDTDTNCNIAVLDTETILMI